MKEEKLRIIAVNKWDAIEKDDKTMNKFLKDIANDLSYMAYAPKSVYFRTIPDSV